jgi:hypothetical protein
VAKTIATLDKVASRILNQPITSFKAWVKDSAETPTGRRQTFTIWRLHRTGRSPKVMIVVMKPGGSTRAKKIQATEHVPLDCYVSVTIAVKIWGNAEQAVQESRMRSSAEMHALQIHRAKQLFTGGSIRAKMIGALYIHQVQHRLQMDGRSIWTKKLLQSLLRVAIQKLNACERYGTFNLKLMAS